MSQETNTYRINAFHTSYNKIFKRLFEISPFSRHMTRFLAIEYYIGEIVKSKNDSKLQLTLHEREPLTSLRYHVRIGWSLIKYNLFFIKLLDFRLIWNLIKFSYFQGGVSCDNLCYQLWYKLFLMRIFIYTKTTIFTITKVLLIKVDRQSSLCCNQNGTVAALWVLLNNKLLHEVYKSEYLTRMVDVRKF